MRVPVSQYWHLLHRYLRPQRRALALLGLALFSAIGLRLTVPLFAGSFVDAAAAGSSLGLLLALGTGFIVAGLTDQVLTVASIRTGSAIGWTATNQLRGDVLEHCLRLDLDFHAEHTPGEMIERIDGDARELNTFFSQFAVAFVGNVLVVSGTVLVLLFVDWRIGLVLLGFVGVAAAVFSRVRGVVAPFWQRSRASSAAMYSEAEEYFTGLDDLRGTGATGYAQWRFGRAQRQLFHHNRQATVMGVLVGNGAELVLMLGATAMLAVAVVLVRSGAITLGAAVSVTLYTAFVNRPLQDIITQIDELQRATASIVRVEELLQRQPLVIDGPGASFPTGALALSVDQVSFGYPTKQVTVLHDVSFELDPGEVLGVVGRTGSGKTTIARLLLRLYDPTMGTVRLGGTDIRQATTEQLRSAVGVVTQEVQLFHASVRDNLTLFTDVVDDARLVGLLREIGLGGWYDRLSEGLDTLLTGGGGLSAGEAQLLAAVRVFVHDPSLVILDEPTSRLDPATERLLDAAFDRLIAGRTAIIIAHRMDTLSKVDLILALDEGRIVEFGPRAALAADPSSAYRDLLTLDRAEAVLPC